MEEGCVRVEEGCVRLQSGIDWSCDHHDHKGEVIKATHAVI